MKHFPPFTCVHEKLQFVNNDQSPLTCNCSSYPRTVVLQQKVSQNPSEIYKEVKALLVTSPDVNIQDKPQMERNCSFMKSSCEKPVEYKTKCRVKRIDKPLYVPPARRLQNYHTLVHATKLGIESITKSNIKRANDEQDESHLNFYQSKNCTSSIENNHNKDMEVCYLNGKGDDTSNDVPNPCIATIQDHINIDFKIQKDNVDSKGSSVSNEKSDVYNDCQSTLSIMNCNTDECNEPSLQETIRNTENSACDSKSHKTTSVCYENSNDHLMKIDLFKFDSSSNAVTNNNLPEQWIKTEIPSLTTEHGSSSNTVYSDAARSLDPDLIKELQAVIGNAEIHSAECDYTEFKLSENFEGEFLDIVEIYGFPVELKTQDLVSAFSKFKSETLTIKWVDDCHAIGIFSSPVLAIQALELQHPLVKVRPLAEGLRESKLVAKRYVRQLQSYKSRPATSAALAKRLVTVALGLKINVPREEREKRKNRK